VYESVEVSSREQEKTLFALKYRFLEWQKVTLADFVAKKRPKIAKPAPADRFWAYFLEKCLLKGARVP
jgi:hypothetical protein